jgi:hypothetical protein
LWVVVATLTLQIAQAQAPVQEVKIPVHIEPHKKFAYALVEYKWDSTQWRYFDEIIIKESGWNANAQNPTSTAFGYGQFLNSTWGLVGCKKTDDPNTQILCTAKYIDRRYGTPEQAYLFHITNNYY